MTTEKLYLDHEKIIYTSINELIRYKDSFCLKKGMTIDDLEQYGRLALWKACVMCNDVDRFPSYAYKVVKGAIKDLIFNHTRIHLIRLPHINSYEERESVSDYLSVDKENEETGSTMLNQLMSPFGSVEDYVIKKIEMEEKLSVMSDKQRRYLIDYLEGYTTTEIAERHKMKSPKTIKTQIIKAVQIHDPSFTSTLRRGRKIKVAL